MMRLYITKRKGQIINFGLTSIRRRTKGIEREVWRKQILEHIDLFQPLLIPSIGSRLRIKKDRKNKVNKNLSMVSDHRMLNSTILGSKKAKEKQDLPHVTTIPWLSGKERVRMWRKITGCDVYLQALLEAFITDSFTTLYSTQLLRIEKSLDVHLDLLLFLVFDRFNQFIVDLFRCF